MPSPEMKRNVASLAMFALPLVLVKISAEVLSGPSSSNAEVSIAPVAAAPGAQAPVAPVWTPQQLAASARILQLRQEKFGLTPFQYDKVAEAPVQPDPIPDEPDELVPEMPKFALGLIMNSSSGKKALINGHPYSEGETIRSTNWVVKSIDPDQRSVVISQPTTLQTTTLKVDTKIKAE